MTHPAFRGLRTAVTGDAAGHGRALADQLAAGGAHIAYCTQNAGDAAMAVQALSDHGTHVTVTSTNLADGAALTRWVETAARDFGGLDLVICSLGDAPPAAVLSLLQAARPHLLRGPTRAFVVVGDAALPDAEAEGLRLHALPSGEGGADALARLLD